MAKFRKKLVVTDAVQWTGEVTNELECMFGGKEIVIKTSHPPMLSVVNGLAEVGDWIIKTNDELYYCKPDIFAATYEEV